MTSSRHIRSLTLILGLSYCYGCGFSDGRHISNPMVMVNAHDECAGCVGTPASRLVGMATISHIVDSCVWHVSQCV